MKNWVVLFTPTTYESVKRLGIIGVRPNVWGPFSKTMSVGDRFIGYVSKTMIFDSYGFIDGAAITDEKPIFPGNSLFPCRRRVRFEKTGLNKPSGDLFYGVAPFNELSTGPGNYLMIKGGFVEVSEKDFSWLLRSITS